MKPPISVHGESGTDVDHATNATTPAASRTAAASSAPSASAPSAGSGSRPRAARARRRRRAASSAPTRRSGADGGEDRDEERHRLGRDERDELADDSLLGVGGPGNAARARLALGDGVLLQRADGRKGNQAHVASFGLTAARSYARCHARQRRLHDRRAASDIGRAATSTRVPGVRGDRRVPRSDCPASERRELSILTIPSSTRGRDRSRPARTPAASALGPCGCRSSRRGGGR